MTLHTRASLHAKVVVVDHIKLFLTSANFTEVAQQRNIEMGLLSHAAYLAKQVAATSRDYANQVIWCACLEKLFEDGDA